MNQDIIKGIKCPYCGANSEYIDSSYVYGKSYGMIYICKPCDAYCGVHKGTDKALGRLANKELREHKKNAHKYFDQIWKRGIMNRRGSYKWLSEKLNIKKEYCHIGMFNVEQCKEVVKHSLELIIEL